MVLALSFMLAGCNEISPRPWVGYAWSKGDKRFEFFFADYERLQDCETLMKASVQPGSENSKWYSEPIGCAYSGNNYWLVWWMNSISKNPGLGCIRRDTSTEAATARVTYSVQLKGYSLEPTNKSYCM